MYSLHYNHIPAPDKTEYNDPPIGLKSITEKDFSHSVFFTHTPEATEYRQIVVKSKKNLVKGDLYTGIIICMRLFWFSDKTGIGMSRDYDSGKVEYWEFGSK